MTDDTQQSEPVRGTAGGAPAGRAGRVAEWLFLDFPYLLFSPGGWLWRALGAVGRLLLALPVWLLGVFFRWQRPFWRWLVRVTGIRALGQVYVQLEKPARIIFWVPVMLANGLLQDIIGGLLPVLLVAALFIYFNKFVIRDAEEAQIERVVGRHPN